MNKYLVTLRLRGQLVKTALYAESAIHARLICEYQFGIGCINSAPTKISNEVSIFPLLDDIAAGSPPSHPNPRPSHPPSPRLLINCESSSCRPMWTASGTHCNGSGRTKSAVAKRSSAGVSWAGFEERKGFSSVSEITEISEKPPKARVIRRKNG